MNIFTLNNIHVNEIFVITGDDGPFTEELLNDDLKQFSKVVDIQIFHDVTSYYAKFELNHQFVVPSSAYIW